MTWVDNKDFKHQRDIQNERNSMKKPKLPKRLQFRKDRRNL